MKIAAIDKKDRPREKLLRLGPGALSDYELLALVLGFGTRGSGVLELAQNTLSSIGGLAGLQRITEPSAFSSYGIGVGKACALVAVAELTRRCLREPADTLEETLHRLKQSIGEVEEAYVIGLNGKNHVIGSRLVGKGDEDQLIVSPPEILRAALALGGKRFVFAHVHPSGIPYPSPYDIDMTEHLSKDAEKVKLRLVDHLILVRDGQFSFKENGMLNRR